MVVEAGTLTLIWGGLCYVLFSTNYKEEYGSKGATSMFWLLKRVDEVDEVDEVGYPSEMVAWREVVSMVVRASNEKEARRVAGVNADDEGEGTWLSSDSSSCVELRSDEEPEVILQEFVQG